jgi:predicted nucleotidyltransferase
MLESCYAWSMSVRSFSLPGSVRFSRELLAGFCRTHHILKIALFGSVLGPAFSPDSDLDVLVEFEPGYVPGLIRMARIERELTGI